MKSIVRVTIRGELELEGTKMKELKEEIERRLGESERLRVLITGIKPIDEEE